MTALTDRYVWAVLRAVPSGQREELEPEIRALVADAIDARAGDASLTGEAAERAALTELGDPGILAARYLDTPQYLIGPRLFPEWKRLLTLLLPIVVPIISIVVLAANLLSGSTVGQAIVSAMSTGFMVAVQTLFWFTLVFAIAERFGGQDAFRGKGWSVDELPELPKDGRIGVAEAVSSVIANIVVVGAILWVMLWPPIVIDGTAYPLFDPALWSFWLPYFLVVTALEIVFTVGLYLRGRWTYALATVNAVLGAAFALPALWLLQAGTLFNPALVTAVEGEAGTTWVGVTSVVIGVSVAAIVAWDAIDGFRKAAAASRNTRGPSNVRRT
jgi:hypothetical protein